MRLLFAYSWLEQFESLDPGARRRVMAKLRELKRAESWPHEPLKGRQFEGLFKLRVGDYRLIYRLLQGGALDFLVLGHRREVYRQ